MTVSELIEALEIARSELGDLPVMMGWNESVSPRDVTAIKIYPERVELRCESES